MWQHYFFPEWNEVEKLTRNSEWGKKTLTFSHKQKKKHGKKSYMTHAWRKNSKQISPWATGWAHHNACASRKNHMKLSIERNNFWFCKRKCSNRWEYIWRLEREREKLRFFFRYFLDGIRMFSVVYVHLHRMEFFFSSSVQNRRFRLG